MADIIKFTDKPIIDDSIEEYEYHEYDPVTGININNGGDIRISIESQDVFTHPGDGYDPESFLLNSKQPITNLMMNTRQTKVYSSVYDGKV